MVTDEHKHRAVEEFQAVGLTEYEAKCYVALSQIPSGTAQDISEIVDIPRTRIYDIAESLHERGLVEIQEGTPRKFRAVSANLAVKRLQREYREHLQSGSEALRRMLTPDVQNSTSGVWRLEGQETVTERGQYISARAEVELFGLFTEDSVFQDNCFRQAHNAIARGVRVILGSPDATLREALQERFPEATIWEPSLDWQMLESWGSRLSRLVMADRRIVLLASINERDTTHEETAIWGEGPDSELVVFCRALIGSELNKIDSEEECLDFSL